MEYAPHGDLLCLLRKCRAEVDRQPHFAMSAGSQSSYYNQKEMEQLRLLSNSSMGVGSPMGSAPPPHIDIPVDGGECWHNLSLKECREDGWRFNPSLQSLLMFPSINLSLAVSVSCFSSLTSLPLSQKPPTQLQSTLKTKCSLRHRGTHLTWCMCAVRGCAPLYSQAPSTATTWLSLAICCLKMSTTLPFR